MAGLLIPEDWDEPTDGFCTVTLTVPNSPLWKAMINGSIWALSQPDTWDADTGDADQAAQDGADIYQSIGVVCP